MARVFQNVKHCDVLVNNAGISGTNRPTHEIDVESWDSVMAVNVKMNFVVDWRIGTPSAALENRWTLPMGPSILLPMNQSS